MTAHRMTTRPAFRTATVALGAAGLALLLPMTPAIAGDDRVERTGSCSSGARWDLKVKTDDGRLEVEGEVDSNRNGQSWAWKFRHNGSVSARGTSTTKAPSGSFSVERRMVNLQGTDKIVFVARHNGQTCRGVVNF
ncbi:MAG: hypothetical protein ACXWDL_00540 [Nocardioides sp.]